MIFVAIAKTPQLKKCVWKQCGLIVICSINSFFLKSKSDFLVQITFVKTYHFYTQWLILCIT